MALLNNPAVATLVHGVFRLTSRCRFLGIDRLPAGPFVLAAPHRSHYDPVVIGALLRREIDWLARDEFYRTTAARWACQHAGCVRLDRYGDALPAVREAVRRLRDGRVVGVFPEGEIRRGGASVLRGGPVRGGAAVLARRGAAHGNGVPRVPCVGVGSEQLGRVVPWLPLRAGRLWIGIGEPIAVPADLPAGRAGRRVLTERMGVGLRGVMSEMEQAFDLPGAGGVSA
ncbi:MAG: lysophospholipid acyltransferase family protein [Planctomycetota bacterium]